MTIAFYAPMKPPDHPVPSGDRQMARLLMQSLTLAGFTVELASRFRSYRSAPPGDDLAEAAEIERRRIIGVWHAMEAARRPRAWFTYHPYYKAPDLIGPEIAARFAIPYVTAEASYAGKRDRGDWEANQTTVASAVCAAALNICFTADDRTGLECLVPSRRLSELAPFIDPAPFGIPLSRNPEGPVRLVTVAMMRDGVKHASYQMLARSLALILDQPWHLTVVGDGPRRATVAAAFSRIPGERLHWAGEGDIAMVARQLATSDIFVWPGTGEAYGIAYLEAQASGLPVVAQATAGVPTVVRHGVTGLLTAPQDDAAFAAAVGRLVRDPAMRQRLGTAAKAFVTEERSLAAAAKRLHHLLVPLLAPAPA